MTGTTTTATFTDETWEEAPYRELDGGRKLTAATATQRYGGELRAESEVRYLMAYDADGVSTFTGIEQVAGSLADHEGAFAILWTGRAVGQTITADGTIIAGSGSGELTGLTGTAALRLGGDAAMGLALTWSIDGKVNA